MSIIMSVQMKPTLKTKFFRKSRVNPMMKVFGLLITSDHYSFNKTSLAPK